MRVTLIHNPGAGKNQPTTEELIQALKEKEYEVFYQSTKEKRIDWNELQSNTDLFVIAGGDGTIGKISRKLIGCSRPIGILPLGTANNIATSLGINNDYRTLLEQWDYHKRSTFTVGEASADWGKEYFIESIGFGLFTFLMEEVYPKHIKREKGEPDEEIRNAVSHLLRLINDFQPMPYEVEIDGKNHSGEYIMVEVMNIKCIGPNLMLAPFTLHHDNELEVVLIEEQHKTELIRYFNEMLLGKNTVLNVPYHPGKNIKILPPTDTHIDDEVKPDTKNKVINICLSKEYLEFLIS
jgi:diacylglycerol kinase (ATP)